MEIAVTSQTNSEESSLDPRFGRCAYFAVYDTVSERIEFLKNPKNSLWIFPQGIVMPPDYRPVKLASGIAYICKKLDGVNLIPIAHRYNFIREDRPEVFVEVGKPIISDNNSIDKKEFTKFLENELTRLLDNQKQDISTGNLEKYEFFIKSRLCFSS